MSLKKSVKLQNETVFLVNAEDIIVRAYVCNNGRDNVADVAIALLQDVIVGLLRVDSPQYLAICFDGDGVSFRNDISSSYNEHTTIDTVFIAAARAEMQQYLLQNDIKFFSGEGFEAVDCIASLSYLLQSTGSVAILSADKRLVQSLDSNVCLWDPFYGYDEVLTLEKVIETFGVTPKVWPDYCALKGDPDHGIRNYLLMGPAEIKLLLTQGIRVDTINLAANFEQLKDRHKDNYRKYHKELLAARDLATLDVNTFEAVALEDIQAPLQTIKQRSFQFPFIIPEFAAGAVKHVNDIFVDIYDDLPLALSISELPECSKQTVVILLAEQIAKDHAVVAIGGEDYRYDGDISELIGYACSASEVVVLDLRDILKSSSDWKSIPVQKFFDLRLAAFVLDASCKTIEWTQLIQQAHRRGFSTRFAGQVTVKLAEYYRNKLVERKLEDWLHQVELPLSVILFEMEAKGILVDEVRWSTCKDYVAQQLISIDKIIYSETGKEIELSSPKQVGKLLYDDLKLRYKGSKKRPDSISIEVLECLDDPSGFVDVIIQGRQLRNYQPTILNLKKYVDNGLVRTTFSQTGSETGRIFTRAPDLQSLPMKAAVGKKFSQCFVAGSGKKFISADYSQAEQVILANYSLDPKLRRILSEDLGDIHVRTASQLYNKYPHSVTEEERNSAKVINYGIMNGMSEYGLAPKLGMSPKEAKKFLDNYMDTFAGVKKFLDTILSECRRDGGVYSLAGRFRSIPNINSSSFKLRKKAERQAFSTKIQGTVADILRCAMCNVASDDRLRELDAHLVLEKHDELILEVPNGNANEAAAILVSCMTEIELLEGQKFPIPLKVNVSRGLSLGDLK